MESPSSNSASAKKLIQARLSFFKAPDKYNEPPRKKLALNEASKEDRENVQNINVIDLASPVKNDCDNEILSDEAVLKKKRVHSEEIIKESKKLKLDAVSRLKDFSKTVQEEIIKDENDPSAEENVSNDLKPAPASPHDESNENAPSEPVEVVDVDMESPGEGEQEEEKEDLNSTLDTSCEAISPGTKKSTPSSKPRKKSAKQLEEALRKKEEKEKLKQEKDLKKQQEKEEKQRLKEEKDLMRKKETEEKEELKRKAKEEKERKRQQEIEMKNEEKKRKEEERKRREEEALRKKEEEKKRKEEEAQKKKEEEAQHKLKFAKEAAVFSTFFTKLQKPEEKKEEVVKTVVFEPFAVKNRMRLAPINRNPLDEARRKAFEETFLSQDVHETYLTQLRCGEIKPGHSANTWPLEEMYQDDDTEVEEIVDESASNGTLICGRRNVKAPRAKLLQFAENRRPPYWGTWRKKCPNITPRKPFGTYKEFDYEVDSDEEWEEEEPGESLHGSDDEKEKEDQEDDDDYDIDNDIFVPHGYLSEDEAPADETWSVEQQKEKLKLLGEQFDQERSEKTKQLRPIVLGCIWETACNPLAGNPKISALLLKCRPWINEADLPISMNPSDEIDSTDDRDPDAVVPSTTKRGSFPDDAVPVLLARIHGATIRRRAIAKEFVQSWQQEHPDAPVLSMSAVSRKVKELAQWQECPEPPMVGRMCWFVSREVREQHGLPDLALRAREQSKTPKTPANVSVTDDSTAISSVSTSTPKITKFTRVLSDEERRLSLTKPRQTASDETEELSPANPAETLCGAVPNPSIQKAVKKLDQFRAPNASGPPKKKVAILFSVPRGAPMIKSSEISCGQGEKTEEKACAPDKQTVAGNDVMIVEEVKSNVEEDKNSQTANSAINELSIDVNVVADTTSTSINSPNGEAENSIKTDVMEIDAETKLGAENSDSSHGEKLKEADGPKEVVADSHVMEIDVKTKLGDEISDNSMKPMNSFLNGETLKESSKKDVDSDVMEIDIKTKLDENSDNLLRPVKIANGEKVVLNEAVEVKGCSKDIIDNNASNCVAADSECMEIESSEGDVIILENDSIVKSSNDVKPPSQHVEITIT